MKINVGREFGRYPAGRYLSDGPYNGERFRTEFLVPALKSGHAHIEIDLTEARGLKSSFLEESFGGLVRLGYSSEELLSRFRFLTRDPSQVTEIEGYMRDQDNRNGT